MLSFLPTGPRWLLIPNKHRIMFVLVNIREVCTKKYPWNFLFEKKSELVSNFPWFFPMVWEFCHEIHICEFLLNKAQWIEFLNVNDPMDNRISSPAIGIHRLLLLEWRKKQINTFLFLVRLPHFSHCISSDFILFSKS